MTINKWTKIVIAGLELVAAKQGNDYFVAVPELEKALGWISDSAREKFASKSLKAFADNTPKPVKRAVNLPQYRGYVNTITTKDFSVVITWSAIQGNEKAASLVSATLNETLERRIDSALGESVTEETYEDRTKAFFRELSRKAFHPKFTTWNDSNSNYGAMVNEYKKYMSLPLVNIDQYNQQQISVWYEGIVLYNSYRYEGYCHKVALEKTRMILADC